MCVESVMLQDIWMAPISFVLGSSLRLYLWTVAVNFILSMTLFTYLWTVAVNFFANTLTLPYFWTTIPFSFETTASHANRWMTPVHILSYLSSLPYLWYLISIEFPSMRLKFRAARVCSIIGVMALPYLWRRRIRFMIGILACLTLTVQSVFMSFMAAEEIRSRWKLLPACCTAFHNYTCLP